MKKTIILLLAICLVFFSCNKEETQNKISNLELKLVTEQVVVLNGNVIIADPLDGDNIINIQIQDTLFQFDNIEDLSKWNSIGVNKLNLGNDFSFADQINKINELYKYALTKGLLKNSETIIIPDSAYIILGLDKGQVNLKSNQTSAAVLYDGINYSGGWILTVLALGLKPSLGDMNNRVESIQFVGFTRGWFCDNKWGGGTKWYWNALDEFNYPDIGIERNRWESWIGLY